jgi:hypothetical protein
MKARMVALGVVWVAATAAAGAVGTEGEAPRAPKADRDLYGKKAAAIAEAARRTAAEVEKTSKLLGISPDELKRLHELGFADAEVANLLHTQKRTARQLIIEREVLSDVSRALAEVNARVHQMSAKEQAAERERAMRAALARVRRERRTSKDDLRKILAQTSFFTPDELKRCLGSSFLAGADDLRRVIFNGDSDDEPRAAK